MKIGYDIPITVTEKQYRHLMKEFGGAVAGREENGKYYIKVWMMEYVEPIQRVLKLEILWKRKSRSGEKDGLLTQ